MSGYAISILIRAFNSERTLDRLLSSLKLQPADEVVVVDSGSTDSTLEVAARHGAHILHAPPPFNYSKSLNIGFRATQNPWVLVISSHCLPLVPDLLAEFRSAARTFPPQVVVGYGRNTYDRRKIRNDRVVFYNWTNFPGFSGLCTNANTLYRRSAWESLAFDESIRTAEDVAWLQTVLDQGLEIAAVPAAWTINLNQYSWRYMFMKAYSDRRAGGGRRMTPKDFFLTVGSVTKKFLFHRMPFGNWTRLTAHAFGQFFGSYGRQDNRPWSKS